MTNSSNQNRSQPKKNNLDPEMYARLKAEAKAPYKGLRKFFYLAFGASGFIGAVVFLAKIIAGNTLLIMPKFCGAKMHFSQGLLPSSQEEFSHDSRAETRL